MSAQGIPTSISLSPSNVCDFMPAVSAFAPASLLPRGAYAVGGRIVSGSQFSFAIPACTEDVLTVQLAQTTTLAATMDRTYQLVTQPGDVVLIPRGQSIHFQTEAAASSDVMVIVLPPQLLQAAAESDLDGKPRTTELRPFLAEERDPLLHGIGWALQHSFQTCAAYDRLYLESLVVALAVHVLRTYGTARPRPQRTDKVLPAAVLRSICDYVEAHLDCPLTLEELGRVAQYSPYHLTRLFRAATGQTLHQYVTARRLTEAKILLETSDLPLLQIALQTGFCDLSHLSKHFRQAYGCAPGAVRKTRHYS